VGGFLPVRGKGSAGGTEGCGLLGARGGGEELGGCQAQDTLWCPIQRGEEVPGMEG